MSTQAVVPRPDRRREQIFFSTMPVVIALIVAVGFVPTYTAGLKPPGLPFWVHLHGAAMTTWIALFAVQAWLVGGRSLRLHRRLGWLSIGLVAVMLPLGVATNALCIRRGAVPPFFTPATIMAGDDVSLLLFVGLYAAGVVLRRQGAWHKRLMLCATVLLSWPAIGRLWPLQHLGLGMEAILPGSLMLLILLALAGPGFDLATRGRVHPAYLWGVAVILTLQPLYSLVAASAVVHGAVRWLTT